VQYAPIHVAELVADRTSPLSKTLADAVCTGRRDHGCAYRPLLPIELSMAVEGGAAELRRCFWHAGGLLPRQRPSEVVRKRQARCRRASRNVPRQVHRQRLLVSVHPKLDIGFAWNGTGPVVSASNSWRLWAMQQLGFIEC